MDNNSERSFLETFGPGLLAASLTSMAVVLVNLLLVPTVTRHQKRIDRMHQALLDTTQTAGLLYGYTWRIWRERRSPAGTGTNQAVEEFMRLEAKAKALAFELPLIFKTDVADKWSAIIEGYGSPNGMSYKLTQPNDFPVLPEEPEMVAATGQLEEAASGFIREIQRATREEEKWWRLF